MTHGYNDLIKKRIQKLQANLAKEFEIDKLSKSPARFNQTKLDWFNKEYIKLLSLEEFVFRCNSNRLIQKFSNNNLRVDDYVYLVDLDEQKVLTNLSDYPEYLDSDFHFFGGGRENGEDSITNLLRETDKETGGALKLDPHKLNFICTFEFLFDEPITAGKFAKNFYGVEGKQMTFYFYSLKESEFKEGFVDEEKTHSWYDLIKVLETNRYLTYAIWKDFCLKNNFEYPDPSEIILRQYLAAILDKNRITKLSEFGLESKSVTDYKTPTQTEITWKKSDTSKSIANLKEIQAFINQLFEDRKYQPPNKIEDLEDFFSKTVADLETKTKQWLTDNSYDLGSYLWPLRVSLSGNLKSPSPFEMMACLDITEINRRIDLITK
jgi:glutamyl/glutaminyl-tRNA synthetase